MTAQHTPIRRSGAGLVSEGEVFAWVHESNPDAYPIADLIVRAVNSHALILEALEAMTGQYVAFVSQGAAKLPPGEREGFLNFHAERTDKALAAIRAATGEDA